MLDKSTLKSLIIELKDKGNSFGEIADILMKEYGTQMSRQAVCGMYNRATSDDAINSNRELIIATHDILMYSSLGVTNKRIKEILDESNYKISLAKIETVIKESKELLDNINDNHVKEVTSMIKHNMDIDEIKLSISYKGEKAKTSVVNNLIKQSAINIINEDATVTLAKVFNMTENRDIVKGIISDCSLDISFRDIGAVLNK